MSDILVCENLKKHFGDVRAVDDVSFKIKKNETTAIVGANGAGKTTLFNVISKMLVPDSGKIWFEGEDITNLAPVDVINKGMVKSFQISSLFEDLTVFENIRIAIISFMKRQNRLFSLVNNDQTIEEKVREIIDRYSLGDKAHTLTKELPHGDRKSLDVAIAFSFEPKVLLLDEPTAGMSSVEKNRTIAFIKELQQGENTFFLIEHDLEVVFSLSQKIIVMHDGKILAMGTPEEIENDPLVREVYYGEATAAS